MQWVVTMTMLNCFSVVERVKEEKLGRFGGNGLEIKNILKKFPDGNSLISKLSILMK